MKIKCKIIACLVTLFFSVSVFSHSMPDSDGSTMSDSGGSTMSDSDGPRKCLTDYLKNDFILLIEGLETKDLKQNYKKYLSCITYHTIKKICNNSSDDNTGSNGSGGSNEIPSNDKTYQMFFIGKKDPSISFKNPAVFSGVLNQDYKYDTFMSNQVPTMSDYISVQDIDKKLKVIYFIFSPEAQFSFIQKSYKLYMTYIGCESGSGNDDSCSDDQFCKYLDSFFKGSANIKDKLHVEMKILR
jgi:hypothetical protein